MNNVLFSKSSLKIYKGLDNFKKIENAVITTGTFDGVHKGHINILSELTKNKSSQESVLITFFPHPRQVIFPDQSIKFINTFEEKIDLISNYKVDHLIIQEFNLEFSRISSLEYIRDILKNKIGLKKLIVGHDHHFGRNREASINQVMEYAELYDFEVHEIPPLQLNGIVVSSTKIRNALKVGNVELANNLLGYNFCFEGKVIHGKGMGKSLGFPTANILASNKNKIVPCNGVYAVTVDFENKKYQGMLNIGFNPTFDEKKLSIELNIFDFRSIIYGKKIKVFFKKRIRDEKKFNSPEGLKSQLIKDRELVKKILSF